MPFTGVPETITASDGTPVNAVRGLLDMIARLVTDYEPTQLVACWDDDWRPSWRVDLIPSYKAHRVTSAVADGVDVEEAPAGLIAQLPVIRDVLAALNISVIGAAHHEADDVIGSLASQANVPVDVVTGDRDLFQLIDDDRNVRVLYTARGMSGLEVLTDATLVNKYEVSPRQYVDYAVLRGDSSDGLPGVGGIGEKTAVKLLQEFGDLEGIISAADDPSSSLSPSVRAKISGSADYLAVAPDVVNVVQDLSLGTLNADIRTLDSEHLEEINRLATEWSLGGSVKRVLRALRSVQDQG